jgi:hypothetical protein
MTKARTIADLGTGFVNISDTGTEGTKVASGTTAQRGTTAGQLRFNSDTGLAEYYTGTAFKSIDSPPTVSSISPSTATEGNTNITITGSSFTSGATVKFIGNDGTEYASPTVTVNSDTQIVAQTPSSAFTVANEPYDVKVINISGLSATLADALDAGGSPTWNTVSGTLATIKDQDTGTHATVSATDPDGQTISYSETGGTVLSTNNFSLDSSTGVISGDPTDVANSTTLTFTLRASDGVNNNDRSFNIIIEPYRTIYFGILGAGGGGGGRQNTDYSGGSSDYMGSGGAGSFVEAVYEIKLGTTIYYYVGHYGQSGQSGSSGGAINAYGGNGRGGGSNDTSGEGGDFSGIFTANAVTQANALIIAGGGGGGAGRPHGTGQIDGSGNGGGRVASSATGEGNDGTRGKNNPTHGIGTDKGGQGGQKNGGGIAGTADGTSNNNSQNGSALLGGNGSSASSWGNGGGGGGGFFGGGGGQDDGNNWGGAGGGAGSSFIRGGITNYSNSAFNSVTATGITYQSHSFHAVAFGYDGGTGQNGQNAYRMKTTHDFSSFGTGYGTNGLGGRENSSYPSAGQDGGHGLVFYRIGNAGSYTKLTNVNTSGTLTSLTIS